MMVLQPKPTYRRSFTYVLTQQGLDRLKEAVQKRWENEPARSKNRNGKLRKNLKDLSSDDTANILGLDPKTADGIYRREPHKASTLKVAFESAGVLPPFSIEKDCIAAPPPHPPTPCLGRENNVVQVATLLQSHSLVTLTGAGGVGKTRLAIEIAESLKRTFRGGTWFVDLARVEDPARVASAVASVLGIRETTGRSTLQAIHDFLGQKPLLLILDNCEHLQSACCTLADHLLSVSAELRILATSRQRLGSDFEQLHPVPPLLEADAIRLFVLRAQRLRPDFAPSQENIEQLGKICRRLDGIPLAIKLAAGQIQAKSLNDIEQGLNNYFHLLVGKDEDLPRHQTMRAMLNWSYDLLDEPERALLRRLAIFADGCSWEIAEQVCADDTLETKAVEDGLAALVGKSLVVYRERAGEAWYLLLEPVRQYGRELLAAQGEMEAVRRRHRDCFLGRIEEANAKLNGNEENVELQKLDAEVENLRGALNGCLEAGEAQIAQRFCGALDRFWQIRGYFTEGRKLCKQALEAAGGQERTAERAEALRCAGHLAGRQGDAALAKTLCKASLAIWQELEDERGIALARISLGNVILSLGRCEEARNLLEASLATFRALGDRPRIAGALHSLGLVAREQRDYQTVAIQLEESLTIRRELNDKRGIAYSLYALGENARNWSDFATARRYCEESVLIFGKLGDRPHLAAALDQLGGLFMMHGDYNAATKPYQESLALYRELGDPHGIAWMLRNMGRLAFAQCRYDEANKKLEEALATFPPNGKLGVAMSRIDLGHVVSEQGDWDGARELFEKSAAILDTLEGRPCAALLRNSLGIVELEQGYLQDAQNRFDAALAFSQEIGEKTGIAESRYNLGLVDMEQGDYDTARTHFEESLAWFQTAHIKRRVAHTLRALGLVDCKQDDFASAEVRHRKSLRLFDAIGNQRDIALSLQAFADLAAAEGQWERAAKLWGAVERLREVLGTPPTPREQKALASVVAEARAQAGRADFLTAWTQGGDLNLEEAIALALQPTP